jgi:hypothetical protein
VLGLAVLWACHAALAQPAVPHAIGVSYAWSHRSASFPSIDGRRQSLAKVGLYYALLGQQGFGTVDWRDHSTE